MVLSRAVHVVCLALAFALCCVQAGYAQAPDDAVALWRLTNPSGGSAVLMGTVHLLPNDDSWADKRLRKAVKQADLLVIEAKTTGKDEAKVKAFALERGFRPIGAPALADTLSPEDATRLRQAEGALNIPVGMTARMQPWFAALNLTLASVMQQGFSAESGAESWLTDRFEKDGEGVGALEGPLDGLSAIASLAEEHQIIMLQAAIEQALSGGEAIGDLYNAWRSGNQSDLAAFILDPSQFHPAIHDAVLTKRNQAWIDPILAYLDTPEEEFIAVGAGHLIGPGDLITLLKEAGVTAERLH